MKTNKRLRWSLLELLVLCLVARAIWFMWPAKDSESQQLQQRETPRVAACYEEFRAALLAHQWNRVLDSLSPSATEQFKDDVYSLMRMNKLSELGHEPADAQLHFASDDKSAFIIAIEQLESIVGDPGEKRSIHSLRLDAALRTATGVEAVEGAGAKRTIRFVRVKDRWLLEGVE